MSSRLQGLFTALLEHPASQLLLLQSSMLHSRWKKSHSSRTRNYHPKVPCWRCNWTIIISTHAHNPLIQNKPQPTCWPQEKVGYVMLFPKKMLISSYISREMSQTITWNMWRYQHLRWYQHLIDLFVVIQIYNKNRSKHRCFPNTNQWVDGGW